ncbi:MAG: deoxyribonuclease IV [Chloroflexota bacterium]
MRLGAQMSTAGGLHTAFQRGQETGCDSMLIFTKSNRQWNAKPLTAEDVATFRQAAADHPHIHPVAVHAAYLINVGSPDPALWEKSYQALKDEVLRADALGIPLLTFHPGAQMESGEETGLAAVARALRRLLEETVGAQVTVCIETMAGTGTTLGYKFEHLAYLLEHGRPDQSAAWQNRLGVCFDTCHVFAAGYEIRTAEGYATTLAEFERLVGLECIRCFHLNDSQYPLGARRDRHDHVGRGHIGLDGFAHFVNDPRWRDHPAHLETEKTEKDENGQEVEMDPVNLATLRGLVRRDAKDKS